MIISKESKAVAKARASLDLPTNATETATEDMKDSQTVSESIVKEEVRRKGKQAEEKKNRYGKTVKDAKADVIGFLGEQTEPIRLGAIAKGVHIHVKTARSIVTEMADEGKVIITMLPGNGCPKGYSLASKTAASMVKSSPSLPKIAVISPITGKSPASNPMTDMLAKTDLHIRQEEIESYKKFIENTKEIYGVGEIDDVITVLHKICLDRIENAHIPCPICKGSLTKLPLGGVACPHCR